MRFRSGPIPGWVVRIAAVVPVLASLTITGAATNVGPSAAGCAQAASVHHAALVVEHLDGSVVTVCVPFSGASITGEQLLALSHVEYATSPYSGAGDAVCQVDGEPAQYPQSCWTASSPYWALYVSRSGGAWTFSSLGVSSQVFGDGDAEGFRYEGQSDYSMPPSPHGVCPVTPPPTPAPTPIPTPTGTERPTPRGAPSHPTAPSSGLQTGAAVAVGSATPSPSSPARAPAQDPGAGPAHSVVATGAAAPGPRTPSLSTGAWAGAGLAAALLVLLVVQLVSPRRRRRLGGDP